MVADGCTDDTLRTLSGYEDKLRLQILEQEARGPAAARNTGARQAQAPLLIFLDDDVEVLPNFVQAHLIAHSVINHLPDQVVIGYLPPRLLSQFGFFHAELTGWWEQMFDRMRKPGYRFRYSDLLTGNLSLPRSLFWQVGGFDERFRVHEDYELGYRLLRVGARLSFYPQAYGYHHEGTNLDGAMQRKYQEGKADVLLGRLYPDLRSDLLMTRLDRYSLLPSRVLRWLAFHLPSLGEVSTRLLLLVLSFAQKTRFLRLWQRLLYGLFAYHYWRGVAEEMGNRKALRCFLSVGKPLSQTSSLAIDLADGPSLAARLQQAVDLVEQHHPEQVKLYYQGEYIGCLPAIPGSEPLRGAHLLPVLAEEFAIPLLHAMARDPAFPLAAGAPHLIELCKRELREHPIYEFPEA